MSSKSLMYSPKMENLEEVQGQQPLLDLPELTLEMIIEKLPPSSLCNMAGACRSLKERCRSDYFWERHMNQKWGRVIGAAAEKEWNLQLGLRRDKTNLWEVKEEGLQRVLSLVRTLSVGRPKAGEIISLKQSAALPADSLMAWYLALESGKFQFPAQVYNRENDHMGFLLSCYDADLTYDARSDTFQARYHPHGNRPVVVEDHVPWGKIRAAPLDTKPHELHISNCLEDLRPGDHFEIQWRRNKEYPYGWWYGVIGHQDSCDGNKTLCLCHKSDTIVLEFSQYAVGSRWRQNVIDRRNHREEGNEAEGFYGGVRKITNQDEISTWKRVFPAEKLD